MVYLMGIFIFGLGVFVGVFLTKDDFSSGYDDGYDDGRASVLKEKEVAKRENTAH